MKEIGHASDVAGEIETFVGSMAATQPTLAPEDERTMLKLLRNKPSEVTVADIEGALRRLRPSYQPARKARRELAGRLARVDEAMIDLDEYPQASDAASAIAGDMNDLLKQYARFMTTTDKMLATGLSMERPTRSVLDAALAYNTGEIDETAWVSRGHTASKKFFAAYERIQSQLKSLKSMDEEADPVSSIVKEANDSHEADDLMQALIDDYPDGILAQKIHR